MLPDRFLLALIKYTNFSDGGRLFKLKAPIDLYKKVAYQRRVIFIHVRFWLFCLLLLLSLNKCLEHSFELTEHKIMKLGKILYEASGG